MVEAFAKMLPKLQAEEALQAMQVAAVAAGNLKKGDARRVVQAWKSQAGRQRTRRQRVRELTPEAWEAMFASMGIGRVGNNA